MSVTDVGLNPSGSSTRDPDFVWERFAAIAEIKTKANELAAEIEKLPPGRRRSVALTNLEAASMWAVKAAACGDD